MKGAGLGAALVVIYTGMMAGADGITKLIAGGYAAPQLFALSALIVVGLSMLGARHGGMGGGLRLRSVRAMAARSVLTVVASVAFFQAFRLLPFADVFLFIGLIPLIAAALSGPVLGEAPRPMAWMALSVGACGVFFLMPGGLGAM